MDRGYQSYNDLYGQQFSGGRPGQQGSRLSYDMDQVTQLASRALQTVKASMGLDVNTQERVGTGAGTLLDYDTQMGFGMGGNASMGQGMGGNQMGMGQETARSPISMGMARNRMEMMDTWTNVQADMGTGSEMGLELDNYAVERGAAYDRAMQRSGIQSHYGGYEYDDALPEQNMGYSQPGGGGRSQPYDHYSLSGSVPAGARGGLGGRGSKPELFDYRIRRQNQPRSQANVQLKRTNQPPARPSQQNHNSHQSQDDESAKPSKERAKLLMPNPGKSANRESSPQIAEPKPPQLSGSSHPASQGQNQKVPLLKDSQETLQSSKRTLSQPQNTGTDQQGKQGQNQTVAAPAKESSKPESKTGVLASQPGSVSSTLQSKNLLTAQSKGPEQSQQNKSAESKPANSNTPVSAPQNQQNKSAESKPANTPVSAPQSQQKKSAESKPANTPVSAPQSQQSKSAESKPANTPVSAPQSQQNKSAESKPANTPVSAPQSQQNKSAEPKPANTPVSAPQSQQNKSAESKPANTPASVTKPSSEGSEQQAGDVQNAKPGPSASESTTKKSQGPANAKDDNDDDTSFCKLCNMAFQGPEQFFRHTRGLLHTQRQMAEAENDEQKEEKEEKKDDEESDEDTSFCKLCNMAFDGPEQFFRHTRGLLHTQRQMSADEAKNPSSTQQPDASSSTSKQQPQQTNRWRDGGGQERKGHGSVAQGGGNVSQRGDGVLGGVRGRGGGITRGTVRGSNTNSQSGDVYRPVGGDTYGQSGYEKGDYHYTQAGEDSGQAGKGYGQGGDGYGKSGAGYGRGGDSYGQSDSGYGQGGDGYGQGGDGFENIDYGNWQGSGDRYSKTGDYGYGGSGAGDKYQGDFSYGDNYGYGQESGSYGQEGNHGYGQDSYSAGRGQGRGGSGKVDGGRDLGQGDESYGMRHGNAYGYKKGDEVSAFRTGGDLDSSGRGRGSTGSAKGGQSVVQRLSAATTSQGLAMIGGDYDEEEEDFEEEEYNEGEGEDDENSKQSFASFKVKDSDDYHCKLCDMKTTGAVSFRAHLNGRSHKLVQDAVENGTTIPRRLLTKLGPGAQVPRNPNPLLASSKTVPVEGPSMLGEALNAVPEAIVGLRFIREYQVGKQPTFHCTICDSQCDISSIQTHLMGTKHRLKYLREYHADVYEHVRTHGGKKSQLSAFLEEVCSDIEQKEGRGEPMMEQLVQDESKTKKEEKKPANKDDTDDDRGKGHGRRVSHDVALARYKEDKKLKEMKEKRVELGYPALDSYERDDRMGPGPGWGPPGPRGYPPHPDMRFRDMRDDPRFRDYPDPRFFPDDRKQIVMSQEERHRLMFAYERHNFYYPELGLPPAEERRRMFLEYERLEIPYEVARRRVMMQEDRLYRVSQYLRDGLDIDDARRRVLAEDNRRQLILAFEKQGLSSTEAKWRVIVEEERAKLFDDYERRGIPPLEARERIMAGKDRMGLIHEYERRGMPPEEARHRAMEEENKIRRHEERLRRGVINDESENSLDKTLTGITEQRLLENYMQQGFTKEDSKNRLIADLRRQGIPTQEAVLRVERIVVRPDLIIEEERPLRSFSPGRDKDRDRAGYRETFQPRDRERVDSREKLGPRGREVGDSRERLGSAVRERADSRERFGPMGQESVNSRERFGPMARERPDSRERLASRDGDHSRDSGRHGPPVDRERPPESGGNIDNLSAEEAKERLLQEYMKRGVPREEARQSLISELIRQGVAPDEARRRFCDPPKAYRAEAEGRRTPGSRQSKSPSRSRSRSRSRERDLSRRSRRDFEGRERDRGQHTSGRDRGPPGRKREIERQREAERQDVEKQYRDPTRVSKEQQQQAAKKVEPEEAVRPTLTLGEELKRMRMKRVGQDIPSEMPAKHARLPAGNTDPAVSPAPSTVLPPTPSTSQRPQDRCRKERPTPSTSDAAPAPRGEVKDLLESLTNNLISSEDDAAMALQVSKALTSALLKYRLKSLPGEENSPGSTSAVVSSFVERRVEDAKKLFEKKSTQPATSSVQTPPRASQQHSPLLSTPTQSLGKQQEIGSKGIGAAYPVSTAGLNTIPMPPQQGIAPGAPPTRPPLPGMNTPVQMPRGAEQSKPRAFLQTPPTSAGGFRPTAIYRVGHPPPQARQEEEEEKTGAIFDRPLGQSLTRGPILPRVIQTKHQLRGGAGGNRGRGQQRGEDR